MKKGLPAEDVCVMAKDLDWRWKKKAKKTSDKISDKNKRQAMRAKRHDWRKTLQSFFLQKALFRHMADFSIY